MNFGKYLKDKIYAIALAAGAYAIILLIFFAFKVQAEVIVSASIILVITLALVLAVDYLRKRSFYNNLLANIRSLDKAYLVLEMLNEPGFYEGRLLCDVLYEINKSMSENVNQIDARWCDYRDYIEMWAHEVKIPLTALTLMNNNDKTQLSRKTKQQLRRIEDCIDQVLFYARSENAEKDYLIQETNLAKVIKNIGIKNMDILLENGIDFVAENVDYKVLTDSKWLEFIIEQIVNNSVKYRRKIKNSYIKFSTKCDQNATILAIEDNGIGIKKSDLRQVFDKSFTGENGRGRAKSTGMGLYIAKSMCDKLGHQISIKSEEGHGTTVEIRFDQNKFYEVLK